jgi:hypothetical protein
MITLLFAGLLATTSSSGPIFMPQEAAATDRRGVAGVCIRWDRRRPSRVAEAIIVRSTGNARLDRRISDAIPEMDWPTGVDDYRGQWLGIWMAVGGAEAPPATDPLPDCSGQTDRSWEPAPEAPAA